MGDEISQEYIVIWSAQGQLIFSRVHSNTENILTADWLKAAYISENGTDFDLEEDLDQYLSSDTVILEAVIRGPVTFVF